MDEICKGVGGENFCPGLLSYADCNSPEYVLVSYGTNDIYNKFEEVKDRCERFYEKLSQRYKESTIIAISPLWRIECENIVYFNRFKQVENVIGETATLYRNVKYIRGYDLIPHDVQYFADAALHPTDEGFEYYVNNLLKE